MTLREYLDRLLAIEQYYEQIGTSASELTIRPYLLGDGVVLAPRAVYADARDVILDFERS